MSDASDVPGVQRRLVATGRRSVNALFAGPDDGEPVFFLHGDTPTAWEPTMLRLQRSYRAVAPDVAGVGALDLADALGLDRVHVVGHGPVAGVLELVAAAPRRLRSVTLLSLLPPYDADTVARALAATPKPPILWARGGDDPALPDPTRELLERYNDAGGLGREVIFPGCGASPHVEKPVFFVAALQAHFSSAG